MRASAPILISSTTLLLLTLFGPEPLQAQRIDGWIDASLSHARPPAGGEAAEAEMFGMAAGRFRLDTRHAGAEVIGYAGRSAEAATGGWFGGSVAGELGATRHPVSLRARAEAFGIDFFDPHQYRAYGAALRPRTVASVGRAVVTLYGDLTRGRWRTRTVVVDTGGPIPPFPGAPVTQTETEDGDLEVTGGGIEILRRVGPAWIRLGGEWYDAVNPVLAGEFFGASAGLSFRAGPADLTVTGTAWETPAGTEFGYQAGLGVPIGDNVVAFANMGRTVTDALYGTSPGVALSLGLSVRLAGAERRGTRVVELGDVVGSRRRVRFRMRAPDAERVALAGDFSGWQRLPMHREGAFWVLELNLPPGLHHFSFVVNGEHWTVPDDAPGIVVDGWGRRNASIVIVTDT